jgi:transcription initiation factor TFIID TATA-box-binding protein
MKKIKERYSIQNLVATTSLEVNVPLVKLAKTSSNAEYNPEQFPGLALRIARPKSVVLIFSSGKLVCTGAKNMKQINETIRQVIN